MSFCLTEYLGTQVCDLYPTPPNPTVPEDSEEWSQRPQRSCLEGKVHRMNLGKFPNNVPSNPHITG